MSPPNMPARRRSAGFTLAELMISMAVGLLLLSGMASLFVSNNRAQVELEKNNRQVENGRYAMQLIAGDVNNAGYYAEFDPTPLPSPSTFPIVCSNTLALARDAIAMPVQGVDNAPATGNDCLPDVKAGTDIVVVRRVETCIAGVGNCAPTSSGGLLFQASLCMLSTELGSTDATNHFALDVAVSGMTRHTRQCTITTPGPLSPIRRYVTHVYYVANNHLAGDRIPTLMRADLSTSGTGLAWSAIPMVEGIENLQVEYGIDNDSGRDGAPDRYNANPASACTDAACSAAAWRGVVAVKLNVLARNVAPTTGHRDTKTFSLGLKADQTDNTVAPANDGFKRHVFQSTIYVPNTAGRRMQ